MVYRQRRGRDQTLVIYHRRSGGERVQYWKNFDRQRPSVTGKVAENGVSEETVGALGVSNYRETSAITVKHRRSTARVVKGNGVGKGVTIKNKT